MSEDHFGQVADAYARYRPHYPGALFEWISSNAPSHALAWDVGCGSGQATLALAERFTRVIATDSSADQIAKAPRCDNVSWRVAPAEASGLDSASADAIVVAQALHWFDRDRFWEEARRVGRRDGLLVVVSYGVHRVADPAINQILHDHHFGLLGPYWPPERFLVDEGYASVSFPFPRVAAPPFPMSVEWSLEQLLGYSSSWSAAKRYTEQLHRDPTAVLRDALLPLWGEGCRQIEWPLTVLAGRLPG